MKLHEYETIQIHYWISSVSLTDKPINQSINPFSLTKCRDGMGANNSFRLSTLRHDFNSNQRPIQ